MVNSHTPYDGNYVECLSSINNNDRDTSGTDTEIHPLWHKLMGQYLYTQLYQNRKIPGNCNGSVSWAFSNAEHLHSNNDT